MANRNGCPKTFKKPEFTDYTLASTKEGEVNAGISRLVYNAGREYIIARRQLRLDGRFWDTRLKPHPVKVRGGYPVKREADPERIRKRGQSYANHLYRFKLVEVANAIKVYVLHATRGWKRYA